MPRPSAKLILPTGTAPAALIPVPQAAVAPGDAPNRITVTRREHPLPVLLCGPILRAASQRTVNVWVATSAPVAVSGRVLQPPADLSGPVASWTQLGSGRAGPDIQLGRRLYVTVVPIAGQYPAFRILAYDLEFHAPAGYEFTDAGGLVAREAVAYGDLPLPTFLLGGRKARLELLHGSCRKLHGPGDDAIVTADEHIASVATEANRRPAVFLFTGDQIYADDVHTELGQGVAHAGELLTGFHEFMSAAESVPAAARGRYPWQLSSARETDHDHRNRQGVLRDGNVGFTFDREIEPHHLMSFGEYAAMYILAWSPALWQVEELRQQLSGFFRPREQSISAIRRVMANTPSYMMMDDHELSDDVPITSRRWNQVRGNPLGRWIVANAWSSFWAFQLLGAGHAPAWGRIGRNLRSYVQAGLRMGAASSATPEFDRARDNYSYNVSHYDGGFTYVTPTYPRIVMLDTRTRRALGAGPPGLLDDTALADLAALIRRPEGTRAPLLLVSPAPVLGVALLESLQRIRGSTPVYTNDPEAWALNEDAFYRFLRALEDSGHETAVIFSGDVHYGSAVQGHFHDANLRDDGIRFAQLTSSALRNQPTPGSQLGMGLVDALQEGIRNYYFQRSARGFVTSDLPFRYRDDQGQWHDAEGARYLSVRFHRAARGWFHTYNNVGIVSIDWSGPVVVSQRLVGPHLRAEPVEIRLARPGS